jgi:hypothetical protein
MLILFFGCYTTLLWAILPMFQGYMLPSSSVLTLKMEAASTSEMSAACPLLYGVTTQEQN